ncbi:GMC family oxidoreductase N-terminal domain-containing protein [Rhizobium sp. BK251]|uniref:GMC family oxidoreductase n=1 Tax=Rhizobium sp. BK251 TaxID=2512125 RepID=UPI0010460D88|nr:GMC family oxidoreductase N-terminal domain-containing protein [Rhizobium sp. BK251]TCL75990.1 choline dehydrogenase-like flavoprotein [Rhizobium sp. BK251]
MKTDFDYIIIGAGSAGCVLAARLSEDPDVTVALVEAGDRDSAPEINIPLLFPQLFKTQFDWDFSSEPEPALGQRRIYLPRGKVLGGSSSTNAMVYIRGNPKDFDDWARQGATGWSHKDLLPYFVKSEANESKRGDLHGLDGPLHVSDSRSMHPLVDRFLQAALETGYARNDDFNGPTQFGVGRYQVTQHDGERWSAARGYLWPAIDRPNLHLFTGALVQRIEFDGRRARRVVVRHNDEELMLRTHREIILSAGTYGSPHILMLSGIGPADALNSFNISPIVDLPVGEDLQDHPFVLLNYLTDQETLIAAASQESLRQFEEERRGPLTSNVAEGGGFISTSPRLAAPDIQITMGAVMFVEEALTAPYDHGFGLGPTLIKPTSRGKVTLRSARPDAKPRIFCNLLATPKDRSSMIAGVRACMEIAGQPSLKAVRRQTQNAPLTESDDDIWSFIQQRVQVFYHPTSTCSIGKVVDSQLNVAGVEGLRVVDASVMPTIVRGNTNAATIAIAERASDLIAGRPLR